MRFEVAPFDIRIPVDVTVLSGMEGAKKLDSDPVEPKVQKTTTVEVVPQPVSDVATGVDMAAIATELPATEPTTTEPLEPLSDLVAALQVETEPCANVRPSLELKLRKGESLRLAVDYFVRQQHSRLLAPTLTDPILQLVDAALVQREREMEMDLQRQLDAVTGKHPTVTSGIV